jgi:hypothetical protein
MNALSQSVERIKRERERETAERGRGRVGLGDLLVKAGQQIINDHCTTLSRRR